VAGERILMGVIGRPHGVHGRVRVQSYTADPADLPAYAPLVDDKGRQFSLVWVGEGVAEIAEIRDGVAVPVRSRNAAEALVNTRLYADRDRLPPADEDEFYLADLVGLEAVGADGAALGRVDAVHDHGAGAFLEIGERMVPFNRRSVPVIDLAAGRLTVALPAEVDAAHVAGGGSEAA
jgi:16S rRNA processing protein RimM